MLRYIIPRSKSVWSFHNRTGYIKSVLPCSVFHAECQGACYRFFWNFKFIFHVSNKRKIWMLGKSMTHLTCIRARPSQLKWHSLKMTSVLHSEQRCIKQTVTHASFGNHFVHAKELCFEGHPCYGVGQPAAPPLSLFSAGAAWTLPVRAVAAQKVCVEVYAFPSNAAPPFADLPFRGPAPMPRCGLQLLWMPRLAAQDGGGSCAPLAGRVAHADPTLLSRSGKVDGSGASGQAEHIGTMSDRAREGAQGKRNNSHMGVSQKCSKLGIGKLQSVSSGLCSAPHLALWLVYVRVTI